MIERVAVQVERVIKQFYRRENNESDLLTG